MGKAEMCEFSAGDQVQKFDSPRQLQHGRRDGQEILGHGEDGADRTDIGSVPVIIMASRLLRLRGFGVRFLCGNGRGDRETGAGQPDLTGRCGCRVKMPPRQRKLDRDRKQRQPRAVLEVLSKPVHNDDALSSWDGTGIRHPMLYYNISRTAAGVSMRHRASSFRALTIPESVRFAQHRRAFTSRPSILLIDVPWELGRQLCYNMC